MSVESNLLRICLRPEDDGALFAARRSLLDWLGCIAAARHEPVACALDRALGADLLARAFDAGASDAQTAAFATGALGNVLEMDDLHRASLLHAGDTICAAALAVALRREDATGGDLLRAILRGYEIGTRIGTAAASGGYTPFYNSGTCGVFGAALAAASLHGLDSDGCADAIGQAGMQAAGIWQCRLEPTFSKQLATANAARAGVLSAELAQAGFPGARAILTGEMGFFASYYPHADPGALADDPGTSGWAIETVSFKPFAACRHCHPAISAALDLRDKLRDDPPERIDLATYGAALSFCDRPEPVTPDEARFSLQHAVAVAILHGAPRIADFEGAALHDPALAALRARVQLHLDAGLDAAFPGRFGAALRITTASGKRIEARRDIAWGDPEDPMSPADLLDKFRANAAHGGMDPQAAETLLTTVSGLGPEDDLSPLRAALRAAFAPSPEYA